MWPYILTWIQAYQEIEYLPCERKKEKDNSESLLLKYGYLEGVEDES